jgi:hypothetical protein
MRKAKIRRPKGVVLYSGPSSIDGSPIVAIATFKSDNSKTGNMIQSWILRPEQKPTDTVAMGADVSICGNCPHRGFGNGKGRSCYVNVGNSPNSVWKGWVRGIYPRYDATVHARFFNGREFRLGAYGDPSAVPFEVWENVVREVQGHTGYTHQWRTLDQRFSGLCMASCDSPKDREDAVAKGWRTFRVKGAQDAIMPGEFVCPASDEGGHRVQCIDCMACGGTRMGKMSARAGGVVINVHGLKVHVANHTRRVALTISIK